MPRARPQLSITLPRNFTFHYTENQEPQTPEREQPVVLEPAPPRAEGPYRIKRRSRPALNTILQSNSTGLSFSSDDPIPTIETSQSNDVHRPSFLQRATEPAEGCLAPVAVRKFSTLPCTPEPQQRPPAKCWNTQQDVGESISRPMSTVSLLSDSSDNSNGSLTSYTAGEGSCTSPESDAPDPFRFSSIKRAKGKHVAALAKNSEPIQEGLSTRQTRVRWTSEMDKHLWSTYLVYIQDPTVTPFKMLPGVPPPLGVCHRVAREARRTWRGGRSTSLKPSGLRSPLSLGNEAENSRSGKRLRTSSADTIKATRSGSNTPTGSSSRKAHVWPKSGSSTRGRLRVLSKRKPTIAPHYQRLLQSRSPSPFPSSSRSQSRLSEFTNASSPPQASFNTRDIQLSLTTSTAATMQPSGPLAQLATENGSNSHLGNNEWFNEPPAPFASEISIPSDVAQANEPEIAIATETAQISRLGSPFGYHTWGPSRTKQRSRPSTARIQSSDASTLGPSIRSPFRPHDTFPYPGIHKRRARHQLEDELSPGGSSMQPGSLDDVFGSPAKGSHRRVRSRGFSLGDMNAPNPLESLFTPPAPDDQRQMADVDMTSATTRPADPVTPTMQTRRLDSPFHGITARPATRSTRHMAAMSLGSFDSSPFRSIGETLGHANRSDDVRKHFPA